jgi:hypothetical protein
MYGIKMMSAIEVTFNGMTFLLNLAKNILTGSQVTGREKSKRTDRNVIS